MRGDPEDSLVLAEIQRLVFRFRGVLQRVSQECGLDTSPVELETMLKISHNPGTNACEVGRLTGRDKGQITRLVQELEAKGWVRRAPDARDRRVQRLFTTEAGEAIHAQIHAVREAQVRQMLERLDAEEQATLGALLAKLNGPAR